MRLPSDSSFVLCGLCGLCNDPRDPMLPIAGEGPVPADIMFIGQAPGRVEQRVGRPFQGPAGQQLDMVIHECNLTRDEIYITNVVKQRAEDGGKDRKPTYAEMATCVPWLLTEFITVRPKVVVLFGETAQQLAFPGLKPAQAQGLIRAKGGALWLATYHPAFILYRRDPELRGYLVETVQRAARLVQEFGSSLELVPDALELMPGVTSGAETSSSRKETTATATTSSA